MPPCPPSGGHFRALTFFAEAPDSVRAARDMTRTALQSWGLGSLAEDARLVVSELVGNVVHHAVPDDCLSQPGAARRVDVLLKAWPGWLFIGVADEDSTSPDLPVADFVFPDLAGTFVEAVLPDSGRGLFIVQRLVDALWCSPKEGGGKIVWCRFDLDPERVDGRPSAIHA
ncbi:ATP-binding protein [Streptomyces sp. NPDC051214]|uniref:ATP-binding protein n=1 Tax=Streptomyces sp. NPDC051214 TaxID=3155282 RepID=UPI00343693D2